MKVISHLLSLCGLLAPFGVAAQNDMTASPYSMFGIGEIVSGLSGVNAAMGGISIAMRDAKLINADNPAGLTAIDTCSLLAEVSAFAKWESYKSRGGHTVFTGNFSGFSLAGRIVPRWYMAAGLTPYSSVGYYFQSTQELEGSPGSYYTSTFSGSGGLSEFFVSNAFRILPSLSVGANVSFIWGSMTEEEEQSSMTTAEEMNGHTFSADFGVQYTHRFSRDLSLTAGAVYGLPTTIRLERTETLVQNSVETTDDLRSIRQRLPQYAGAGVALTYKQATYALDYTFRPYSSLTSEDSRVDFRDVHELRAGFRYASNVLGSSSIWKRMDYKLGLVLSTPYYMQVRDQSGPAWRATAGLGFPMGNGRLHTAFFYERVNLSGAFRRATVGLTVTYSLSELFYRARL